MVGSRSCNILLLLSEFAELRSLKQSKKIHGKKAFPSAGCTASGQLQASGYAINQCSGAPVGLLVAQLNELCFDVFVDYPPLTIQMTEKFWASVD